MNRQAFLTGSQRKCEGIAAELKGNVEIKSKLHSGFEKPNQISPTSLSEKNCTHTHSA
ncbi:Hypothetical predicted protein [Podarcis lilfordi]|uniref:Uncharacterized protein n=1 Tax=Podarcis lilfordi TaxID=74358 RepID=A0AA35L337_9SAUR|nr:Hypothetical predicted protein [Podarcis lilfordi]